MDGTSKEIQTAESPNTDFIPVRRRLQAPAKGMANRPTQFIQEIAEVFLERIRDGETLRGICRDHDMPSKSTILIWCAGRNGAPMSWETHYARARLHQADSFANDIIDLADSLDEQSLVSARIAVDNLPPDATEREKRRAHFFAKKRSLEAGRLQIDTRKWAAARMAPHHWGDRVTLDVRSDDGNALIDFAKLTTEQLEQLAELRKVLAPTVDGTEPEIIDITPPQLVEDGTKGTPCTKTTQK
jgi:hypothetical protein